MAVVVGREKFISGRFFAVARSSPPGQVDQISRGSLREFFSNVLESKFLFLTKRSSALLQHEFDLFDAMN